MDVRAYDLGDPQLSTIISVPVFVRHVATVPPDVGLGFSDDSYTVEVPENSPSGALIKVFSVISGRVKPHAVPLRCSIISGNEAGNKLCSSHNGKQQFVCILQTHSIMYCSKPIYFSLSVIIIRNEV